MTSSYNHPYFLRLAYRNLYRKKLRCLFIGLSVSLSVALSIWIMCIFDGMNKQIIDAVVQCHTGHYQVQETNFSQKNDPSTPMPDSEALAKQMSALKGVEAVSREMILEGFMTTLEGSMGLKLIGVHPQELDHLIPELKTHIIDGEFLSLKDGESPGVIIGKALSEKLKLNVGDQVIFNFQDLKGDLRSELVSIQGIFTLNGKGYELGNAYLDRSLVAKLYGENQPVEGIHRYVIRASSMEHPDKLLPLLGPNMLVKSWRDLNPEMSAIEGFHKGFIRFFLVIVGICISVTILNPISMLWQERVPELQMMNIIGVTKKRIWLFGFYEAFLMSLFSFALSIVLMLLLIGPQTQTGLNLSWFREDASLIERAGITLPNIVYPIFTLQQFIVTFLFVLVTVLISYILGIQNTMKSVTFR